MGCIFYVYNGTYFEQSGGEIPEGAVLTPKQPDPTYTWNGQQWAAPDPVVLEDQKANAALSNLDQFMFDLFFNHENRMRTLEAKPTLTPAQYRAALVSTWKTLFP